MRLKFHILKSVASVAWLSLGLAASGCAKTSGEEWKTTIPCGRVEYVVISSCVASGDDFELNKCREGQTLEIAGDSISIPSSPRSAKNPAIFATHWQCVTVDAVSYLLLDFSSGSGRTVGDESVEIYDHQLRRVVDDSIIRNIYKHLGKATEGYVRSIYPTGGG